MTKIFSILLAAALMAACGKENEPRFERLDAAETGIDFNNEILEKDTFNILRNEYMYNGGGVGVADFNNDGLQDLVFTGNKVLSRIYLNLGGFNFKDITGKFEGLSNEQWLSGAVVVDINADGLDDLYLTSTMSKDSSLRKNQLWVNQGLGTDSLPTFKEMAGQYGIADVGYSMNASFFDYDLDGDLDLYVLNNIVNKEVPTNYRNKMVDGSSQNNDQFYLNLGNGQFKNITKQAGIVYEGFGLGLAVGDVNKDGYPDLYISNDYISNDLLYINQKDGTFKNESPRYLSYHSKFSMGNDMADVNNDGNLDVMTMDMLPEQYFRKKQTINGNSYFIYVNDEKYGYEHQYVRNMLQVHSGFINGEMQPFSEVGQLAGIYQTEWSWSPLFADFDNDGDRDLLVTNGFPKDLTDKDFTNYKANMYGYLAGDYDIIPKIPIVKVSNYAFENIGDLRFENNTGKWGMDIPSFSNGAAFVDLDNDGDLDYVTNNINDKAFVYRNNTASKEAPNTNFLRIALKGKAPNTRAIGTKIELWAGGQMQYYEHFLTRGYISTVDPVVHFGLGSHAVVDSLRVIWPNGQQATVVGSVKANQVLSLSESDAAPYQPATWASPTLFLVLDSAISFTHQQEDYIDFFQNQRILQHKFSQIGPCMATGDLDGDGQADLFIGGSAQMPPAVFLFKNGLFQKTELPGLTGLRQCLEADVAILDADKDGDSDIVAISGGYANENEADYRHYFYQNNGGNFSQSELPLPPFPASVVRPFDFDQDGDLDLFIGARVKRGEFPLAPASYLLTNDNGKFTASEALSFNLGMVTDAAWSDFDGDGWADLILAREWNSIAILKNKQGKGFEEVGTKDLKNNRGLWSSIAAADLDQDGDEDILLGNLGENIRFHINGEYPLSLYAIDIDNNGTIDPLTTSFWKDKDGNMKEYPVNYLDELAAQSPFFRKRFTSYTQFSHTAMDSILDKKSLKEEAIRTVNTASSYILWNEGGQFKWERMPTAAQVAPIKKILVRDFNGDKMPDVLLAGNDHAFDVSTGYYDANRGVVLLNKGKQSFEVLPPAKTGIALRGQVESLAYLEGAKPWLVVGINKRGLKVFKLASPAVQ